MFFFFKYLYLNRMKINLGHRSRPNCGTSQVSLLTLVNKDILLHSDTVMGMYSVQNRHQREQGWQQNKHWPHLYRQQQSNKGLIAASQSCSKPSNEPHDTKNNSEERSQSMREDQQRHCQTSSPLTQGVPIFSRFVLKIKHT